MSSSRVASVPKYKLMMIGKTGAGKSSFGNFVLGRESFLTSEGLEVVTAKAAADSVMVEGYEVYIVDTPGFGDPASLEDKHDMGMEEMVRGLELAVEDGDPGVDVVLYVVSASDRFTKDEHTAIEAIKGSEFWSHVLVVFTNADRVRKRDKRGYILDVLSGAKCPEALKVMMDQVDKRFMIVNSLDTSPEYRKDHILTLLCNVRSMSDKNQRRRYTNQLFMDIHEKYKELKVHSKEQSETTSLLLQNIDEMRESYMKEIDALEATKDDLQHKLMLARKQGQDVEQLKGHIAELEEEKKRKEQELQGEIGHLKEQLEQIRANYNAEVIRQHDREETIEQLRQELTEKKCDRRHCLLM